MEQKVVQIGNSIGVVIPQPISDDIGIRRGTRVRIEKQGKGVYIVPKKPKIKSAGVNTKFAKMVDEFITEHEDVLRELAKR